jgi:glyoxylate/hydroxypyruvate reductase A
MSAILLAMTGAGWNPAEWQARFSALAPRREVRIWPDRVGDPAEIGYVCAWKPPPGLFAQFPHLKAIFSLGAGVDHLTGDPLLPAVPLVRVVDRDLTARMTEHVVLHVLLHHRRLRLYERQQRERVWWPGSVSGWRVLAAPKNRSPASRRSTAKRVSTPFSPAPRSWSACCRTRRRPKAS